MINEAKCPKCGEEYDIDFDDMEFDVNDDSLWRSWTCKCMKCHHKWTYYEIWHLVESGNEEED